MALKRAGASYSALRAATRLPPVAQSARQPAPLPDPPPAPPSAGQPVPESPGPALIAAPDPAAAERVPDIAPPEAAERAPAKAVYYRLRVPYPATGVCAEFDEIARAYDAETAIQTVFKRAFEAWVAGFGPETATRMDTDYPRGSRNFATSRLIGPEIVAAVEKAIDPMGIRTKTFIAERIALAAMTAYIAARDPAPRRK